MTTFSTDFMTGSSLNEKVTERLCAASDAVQTESQRIEDEIEAFEVFETELQRISITPQKPLQSSTLVDLTTHSSPPMTETIQEPYQSTVMAVPHYEEDYGESFFENLSAEFGPELVTLIDNAECFDRRLKSIIETHTQESITERENLATTISAEQEAIERIAAQLQKVATQVESLQSSEYAADDFCSLESHWRQLETLEAKCDTIAAERQATIRTLERKAGTQNDQISLNEYLYQDLQHDYPVLASIALIGQYKKSIQAEVENQISCVNIRATKATEK